MVGYPRPQLVEQRFGGDDLVGPNRKSGQHGRGPGAERDAITVASDHLDRAQHPDGNVVATDVRRFRAYAGRGVACAPPRLVRALAMRLAAVAGLGPGACRPCEGLATPRADPRLSSLGRRAHPPDSTDDEKKTGRR